MRSTLVLGLGKSGIAAARHALIEGDDLTIYAGVSSDATRDSALEFEQAGAHVVFDEEDVKGRYDICIVSPGIPQTGAFYKSARQASDEIVSEPEYAWRLSPDAWVAVTGTNGKTTTTSWVTHLFNACGRHARSCGNIGTTCLEAVMDRTKGEVLVAEMSSYQLASTCRFAPEVAILLNITPDHIKWHGSYEAYALAKFKVFENMGPGTTAVVGSQVLADYPELEEAIRTRGARLIAVGEKRAQDCAYLDKAGVLTYVEGDGTSHELAKARELPIRGEHNVQNALCASAAAIALGCDTKCVSTGLLTFSPLEHRLEPCGCVGGVTYYNDSKATNVDATLKALTAFSDGEVVLLLGGRDKGTELAELVAAGEQTCSAIVAYGEAGQRFYEAFESCSMQRYLESGMREALARAREIAKAGQSIVLSPACASFDEFDSFEQRGSVFKNLVRDIAED